MAVTSLYLVQVSWATTSTTTHNTLLLPRGGPSNVADVREFVYVTPSNVATSFTRATGPFHVLDTPNRYVANTLRTGGHFDLTLPTLEYLLSPVWLVTQSAKVAPPRLASYWLQDCGTKKQLQVYSCLIINRPIPTAALFSPVATTTVSHSIMSTPT